MRGVLAIAAMLLLAPHTAAAGKPRAVEILLTADVWGEHGPCG